MVKTVVEVKAEAGDAPLKELLGWGRMFWYSQQSRESFLPSRVPAEDSSSCPAALSKGSYPTRVSLVCHADASIGNQIHFDGDLNPSLPICKPANQIQLAPDSPKLGKSLVTTRAYLSPPCDPCCPSYLPPPFSLLPLLKYPVVPLGCDGREAQMSTSISTCCWIPVCR